jgi:photosystem II stability/assembly factor-like uncharacterized protein
MRPKKIVSISFLFVFFFLAVIGLVTLNPKKAELKPTNKQWFRRSDGLGENGINTLALHPLNNAIYYAGSRGQGLFVSTNYTKKWKKDSSETINDKWINCITINKIEPTTIYIGTMKGLLKSTNSGSDWIELVNGMNKLQVFSVAFHPTNPAIVFVGTLNGAVLKSTNFGTDWVYLYDGIPDLETKVTSIVIDPINPNIIYAGLYGKGLIKSINNGFTWIEINEGLYDRNILSLIMDPRNPSILYTGTKGGIFKTENSGSRWLAKNEGLTSVWKEVYSIDISPLRSNEIYAGTNKGMIYFSTTGGEEWTELPPIVADEKESTKEVWIYDIKLDYLHPTMLYAATNKGIYRFRNANSRLSDSLLLQIDSPTENEIINNSNVIVSGRAGDSEFGLERVVVNDQTVNVDSKGHFETSVSLGYGINTISIIAFNCDDFSVTKTIKVYGVTDLTGPIIEFLYPDKEGINYSDSQIEITGQVNDPETGLDSLWINNQMVLFDEDGSFKKFLFLQRGQNIITCKAINCAGKISEKTIIINCFLDQ